MNILLVVLSLAAAAQSAPQFGWPQLMIKDPLSRLVALHPGVGADVYYVPVSARAVAASAPDVLVPVARQDTSRGLPNPVQDTPEVAAAKIEFQRQYEKAAVAAALAPERRRRDVSQREERQILPMLVTDWSMPFYPAPNHPVFPHYF